MGITKRAGHAPSAGPPTKEITPLSEIIAQVNAIKQMMQSMGLDKDWILSGTDAGKPAAEVQNRIYCATDTKEGYIDTGSAWVALVGLGAEADPLAVHKDGSVALTANWDVGAFGVQANKFYLADDEPIGFGNVYATPNVSIDYDSGTDNLNLDLTNATSFDIDWTNADYTITNSSQISYYFSNFVAGTSNTVLRAKGTKAVPAVVAANTSIVDNDLYAYVTTAGDPAYILLARWGATMTNIGVGVNKAMLLFGANSLKYVQIVDGFTSADDFDINFITSGNNGLYTWSSAGDGFIFSDDILMNSTERIYFNDTNTSIYDDGTDLLLSTNGVLRFGTHAAIGAETVTGYITIKDSAGNSRKLAVVS